MKEKILDSLSQIKNNKVVIVGDLMLDKYQWGEVERISPEAPVPVVRIEKEDHYLGGAGNVARNIKYLGGNPYLIGICGQDQAGQQLRNLLKKEDIEHTLLTSKERKTTEKIRVIARNQQVVRVDMDPDSKITSEQENMLLTTAIESIENNYVIASDYGKGVIGRRTLEELTRKFKVILDPKTVNKNIYQNLFLMTPNRSEAGELIGLELTDKQSIINAGKKLQAKYELQNLVITMGGNGMAVFEQQEIWHIPTLAQKVFDVTGAGDTVIGTLALSLQAGNDLLSSCQLANAAAGHVVAQVGTAAARITDIREMLNEQNKWQCEQWK